MGVGGVCTEATLRASTKLSASSRKGAIRRRQRAELPQWVSAKMKLHC